MKGMKDLLAGQSTYQRPQATKKPDKEPKRTWEGVEVVDYFEKHFNIPKTGPFGYTSWLRRVKTAGVTMYHAKKLIEIMIKRETWLHEEKGEELHRGKWMFNRFRFEIKEKGIDRFISSQMP